MSRALVIKNADFNVNKLGTIMIESEVPCTGITLSKSTLALTTIGSTDTLVATPAPSGTTDAVVWSTSDADVITVAGGIVTAVGCGTATITATCGTFSASCEVTVTHIAEYSYDLDKYYAYDNLPYLRGGDLNKYATIYSTSGTLKAAYQYRSEDKYPIMIPSGATKMVITCPNYKSRVFWLNSKVRGSDSLALASAFVPTDTGYLSESRTVDIPERTGDYEGLDSFVISFNIGDTISDEAMQNISVVFTA